MNLLRNGFGCRAGATPLRRATFAQTIEPSMSVDAKLHPPVPGRTMTLVALAAGLSIGAAMPLMPRTAVLNGLADDAFYYLQIARNLTHGAGFSFDGLHRTNGFHPLWLFCVAPIAGLPLSDLASVRVLILLQLLIVIGACVDLFRTLRPRIGAWPAATATMLMVALPGSQTMLLSGMESAAIFWLLIRVWRCWLRLTGSPEASPTSEWLRLGAWCSLAFLARLEAGIITPILALLALKYWRRQPKVLLAIVAIPIATLAAYLVWNRSYFHVWIPMSGLVKSTYAFKGSLTAAERLLGSYAPLSRVIESTGLDRRSPYLAFQLYCVALGLLVVLAVIYRKAIWQRVDSAGVAAALAMCAGIWILENVFLPFGASWYPVGPALATALVGGALVAANERIARVAAIGLVLLGVGRSTLHIKRDFHIQESLNESAWEAAEWARDNVPPNERIGSWSAGVFAYASHRQVVNLDGLVNDAEYYREYFLKQRLADYIRREDITWLADGVFSGDSLRRPTYGVGADQATMPMTLAHRACEWRAGQCGGYAVWKISPE